MQSMDLLKKSVKTSYMQYIIYKNSWIQGAQFASTS